VDFTPDGVSFKAESNQVTLRRSIARLRFVKDDNFCDFSVKQNVVARPFFGLPVIRKRRLAEAFTRPG